MKVPPAEEEEEMEVEQVEVKSKKKTKKEGENTTTSFIRGFVSCVELDGKSIHHWIFRNESIFVFVLRLLSLSETNF